MSTITINSSSLGSSLKDLLVSGDIEPGSDVSYQLCKTIYLYHPLGQKMVDKPIKIAQSQKREIKIPKSPETRVREAFEAQWLKDGADKHIANLGRLARMYGIASIAMLVEGLETDKPVDMTKLWKASISFNAFDPLNTAGSLVLNQNPNDANFQHVTDIVVQGKLYHRSRTCVLLNAQPIYLGYTNSAFGYVGTSVYQRPLFPLKSFIKTMVANDLVATKVGVIVAFIKAVGSIANRAMQIFTGQKRDVVKEAETENVISVGESDKIESLDLTNMEGPMRLARTNIIEDIASGGDMPAQMLTEESFAEGFGEGTEDAKKIAGFVDGIREWLGPAYTFFDNIIQYRAWNEEFYATIQKDFPDYKGVPYTKFFYDCVNSFEATFPSLITEPPSEKVKVDDVILKATIAWVEVYAPLADPENKALLLQWAIDIINGRKLLFGQSQLEFDAEAFAKYVPPAPPKEMEEPKPFAAADSTEPKRRPGKKAYDDAVGDLITMMEAREAPKQLEKPALKLVAGGGSG